MLQMGRRAEKNKEAGAWGRGGSVVSPSSEPRHTPDSTWRSPATPLRLPHHTTRQCVRFLSALLRHPESRGGELPIYRQDPEERFKTIFLSPFFHSIPPTFSLSAAHLNFKWLWQSAVQEPSQLRVYLSLFTNTSCRFFPLRVLNCLKLSTRLKSLFTR